MDCLLRDRLQTGALITYPPSLTCTEIIRLIINELCNSEDIVVVTDTMSAINNVTVVDYGAVLTLNHTGIVIFDNGPLFAVIAPLLPKQPPYKIIVLVTWGLTLRQLTSITDKFPNLLLLNLNHATDKITITWCVKRIPLSPKQLHYYDKARTEERVAPISNSVIPYPITRMLTLYTYPDEIMLKTLTRGTTCRTIDRLFFPTSIEDLYQDGPKLLALLDEISNNKPAKQIVVTRFNHYYGTELITQFLELCMNREEIYPLSCSDSHMKQTLTEFNESTTGILVTNVIPVIPILADIVHIVDTYSFLTIQGLLGRLINRDVCIYSYVATHPNELSSDEALYNNLVGYIAEVNNVYTTLRKRNI